MSIKIHSLLCILPLSTLVAVFINPVFAQDETESTLIESITVVGQATNAVITTAD